MSVSAPRVRDLLKLTINIIYNNILSIAGHQTRIQFVFLIYDFFAQRFGVLCTTLEFTGTDRRCNRAAHEDDAHLPKPAAIASSCNADD